MVHLLSTITPMKSVLQMGQEGEKLFGCSARSPEAVSISRL